MDNNQFFKRLDKCNIESAEKGMHTMIKRYYNKNNKVASEG